MNSPILAVRKQFEKDFSLAALRSMIIVWGLMIIGLALVIDNKWVLAGILAYEVLP